MPGTIKLVFTRPVDDGIPIIPDGGEYGASRPYGSHIGVDFSAYLDTVYACEGGRVVYSDNRAGSENRTNYGNVVVIDHAPDAGEDQRHIYSLYAHLDSISTSTGTKVKKGSAIGISGNTGTTWYYKGMKRGFHLHFEIIDSQKGFDFSGGWPLFHLWRWNQPLRSGNLLDCLMGSPHSQYYTFRKTPFSSTRGRIFFASFL